MTPPAAGLVLAAGAGSRLGRVKALVEVDGVSLVARAVGACREAALSPVVVVAGAAADAVAAAARRAGGEAIANPRWSTGMASSMAVGLEALDGRADAAVVVLVDQPGIGAQAIRRVVAAWRDGATVAAASYHGRRGHPVLFDAACWEELRAGLAGDAGARGFLATHPDLVRLVPCEDVADDTDLDTPADLRRWPGHR